MGQVQFNPNGNIIKISVALFSATLTHCRLVDLALDTGASKTCIAPDAIRGLGYTPENVNQQISTITASGLIYPKVVTLSKLFAVGESVENINVLIQQFPDQMADLNIQGLLGLDFLRNFDINICFSSGFIDIKRI